MNGPAPLAPVKVTVLVVGVKVVMFQLPPTLIASAPAAASPAPVRFTPTVRGKLFSDRVPAVMPRLLAARTEVCRVPPLLVVRL